MLTLQIRELEADGVVKRKAENTVPEKVEYSLTKLGEKLSPIISSMGNRISESFKTAQSVMKGTWLTIRHSFMPIKKPGRKNSRSSQALSISKYKELHHFTLRFFQYGAVHLLCTLSMFFLQMEKVCFLLDTQFKVFLKCSFSALCNLNSSSFRHTHNPLLF